MKRLIPVGLAIAALAAAGIAAWAISTESAVSRETVSVTCPADLGSDSATVIEGHLDYPIGGGSATPEAAVRSAAVTMKMPGLPSQATKVASSSRLARFELPGGQGVLLVAKREGKWAVEKTAMCQQLARMLVQP